MLTQFMGFYGAGLWGPGLALINSISMIIISLHSVYFVKQSKLITPKPIMNFYMCFHMVLGTLAYDPWILACIFMGDKLYLLLPKQGRSINLLLISYVLVF